MNLMVNRKLNKKRLVLFFISLILIFSLIVLGIFFKAVSPVSDNEKLIKFEVLAGETGYVVFDKLEEQNLIRNKLILKIYNKITGGIEIEAGTYLLSESMSSIEIYKKFKNKESINENELAITLREGQNILDLIEILEENTKVTSKEFLDTLKDKDYLNELINEYWFLNNDILDKDIYYSLEGYLYPDTYNIYKDSNAKDIIKVFLKGTLNKLNPLKDDIENSELSIHEIITLASIVERESGGSTDKDGIASVFMNRINDGWSLGSDVTTYYGLNLDLHERDLTYNDLTKCNKYNTSSSSSCSFPGLPIGPISSASLESIKASINPDASEYYYFVADKNKKTYFNKTFGEHERTIEYLKSEGLWYEYE